MGGVAIAVVIVLLIMSVYSIAIMVERYLTYSAAKKQSREFAPRVAQALKNDRIEEAINISDKHRKSHLAMVVSSGLQEFRAHEGSSDISGDEIEASKRALQRAIAIKTAEFKRGLSGLATIGSTAPFVGLFGTVFGIINAFRGMKNAETAGIGAVAVLCARARCSRCRHLEDRRSSVAVTQSDAHATRAHDPSRPYPGGADVLWSACDCSDRWWITRSGGGPCWRRSIRGAPASRRSAMPIRTCCELRSFTENPAR